MASFDTVRVSNDQLEALCWRYLKASPSDDDKKSATPMICETGFDERRLVDVLE